MKIVSATPIVAGCRMIKSAHELDLMRVASQATLKCYEAVFKALKPGMTQNDVSGSDWRRLRPSRLSRLRQHSGRRVHGAAARIDHAADDP